MYCNPTGNVATHFVVEIAIAFIVAVLEIALFVYFKGIFIVIAIIAVVLLILKKFVKK